MIIGTVAFRNVMIAHARNIEDYGTEFVHEDENFFFFREKLLLGFNFFNERIGQSTRREYDLKNKKIKQIENEITVIASAIVVRSIIRGQ